jgi:hypothetical protein
MVDPSGISLVVKPKFWQFRYSDTRVPELGIVRLFAVDVLSVWTFVTLVHAYPPPLLLSDVAVPVPLYEVTAMLRYLLKLS